METLFTSEELDEPQSVVATLAGTRHVGSRDGEARNATFASPRCVTTMPDGSLLVVDSGNNRLRKICDRGGGPLVSTLAPRTAWLNPRSLALLPDGAVVVCNTGHNRLVRFDLETKACQPFAGCGRKGHRDGSASKAEFNAPSSVCVCGDGTVLVADTGNHVIRSISGPPEKRIVHTIAGVPTVAGHRDGQLGVALLHSPAGIVAASLDAQVVYIADTANHVLRCLTQSSLTTVAGVPGTAGFIDGPLAEATFSAPTGLAVLPDGRLLVADTHNNCIRRLCFAQRTVCTVAGRGGPKTWGAVDGSAQEARFNLPQGIAVGGVGEIWIADSGNHCVRMFCALNPVEGEDDMRSLPVTRGGVALSHVSLRGDGAGSSAGAKTHRGGTGGLKPKSKNCSASPNTSSGACGRDGTEVGTALRLGSAIERHGAPHWQGLPRSPSYERRNALAAETVSTVARVAAQSTRAHETETSARPRLDSSTHSSRSDGPFLSRSLGKDNARSRVASPSFRGAVSPLRADHTGHVDDGTACSVGGRGGPPHPMAPSAFAVDSFSVQLFERAHDPSQAHSASVGGDFPWKFVGAAEVWVGPALLDVGGTSLPRFGVPSVAELLVKPAAAEARRTLVASVGQISVHDSVFVCCVPPPPKSAAAAALARATGCRSEQQVGLRFRSEEAAASFIAGCREALAANALRPAKVPALLPPHGFRARTGERGLEERTYVETSSPLAARETPPSSPGLVDRDAAEHRSPGGSELDANRREILYLTSQLAEREGQIVKMNQQLAAMSRAHKNEMNELRRQFEEERAYWRSHMSELVTQVGGNASYVPLQALSERLGPGGQLIPEHAISGGV